MKSPKEISSKLNVSLNTVKRILRHFSEVESTDYKSMGEDKGSIIRQEHIQAIFEMVDNNNTITLEELQHEIIAKFNDIEHISISTLCRFLNKIVRLTLKRATPLE